MPDYSLYSKKLSIAAKISSRAREKMFDRFMSFAQPTPEDLVLDVGVTPYNEFPNNYFEKLYPWTANITMCSVEDASNLEREFPGSKFVRNEPGKPLPFRDAQFDIVFCNAVLEHVAETNAQNGNKCHGGQAFFLDELIRIGKKVFLTTPNRWYPIEFHTVLPLVHWLPQPIHQKILRLFGMDFYAQTENLSLLSTGKLKKMMSNVKYRNITWTITYHWLLGIPSNIILMIKQ